MRIEVDAGKCNACQLCVKKCPYNAIQIQNKCAQILPACILCGVCVEICPQKALTLIGVKQQSINLEGDIWVYLEIQHDVVSTPSMEIVSKLHQMLDNYPHKKRILGIALADHPDRIKNTEQLSAIGLDGILGISDIMKLPLEQKAVTLHSIIQ